MKTNYMYIVISSPGHMGGGCGLATRLTYMVVHIHVLVEAAAVADLNKRLPITV